MKVVINNCFGGFSLSKEAYEYMGIEWDGFGFAFENDRKNPKLADVVEQLKEKADGFCANLKVVKIPDGVEYEIDDYDGMESIHEVHRSWS